jgi:hypothetical protein
MFLPRGYLASLPHDAASMDHPHCHSVTQWFSGQSCTDSLLGFRSGSAEKLPNLHRLVCQSVTCAHVSTWLPLPSACHLQGISTSTNPFVLWPKAQGPDFWAHLKASPRQAATFDGGMRACNHTGASMAVEQYPWNR